MNAVPIRKDLKLVGAWCALVAVTVLLTLLFSILGNLSCAVVAGLILGSVPRSWWKLVSVSLIFPAVILAFSFYSKVELATSKVYLVAMVTGAAFWVVFGLTLGLHLLERKEDASPIIRPGMSGNPGPAVSTIPEFGVAVLRGSWTCEDTAIDGLRQVKTLRIEDGKFSLTISKPRRQECIVARGNVSMDEAHPGQVDFTSESVGIRSQGT